MKNKKLIGVLALTAVVANLGIATVFAQTPVDGVQEITCTVAAAFTGGTPAAFNFASATVSTSNQLTTATEPLEVTVCTDDVTSSTVDVYATDFTPASGSAAPIPLENVTLNRLTTDNDSLQCKVGESCTTASIPSELAVSTPLVEATLTPGVSDPVALYDIVNNISGIFTIQDTDGGLDLDLTIPANQPAGTYTSVFTFTAS